MRRDLGRGWETQRTARNFPGEKGPPERRKSGISAGSERFPPDTETGFHPFEQRTLQKAGPVCPAFLAEPSEASGFRRSTGTGSVRRKEKRAGSAHGSIQFGIPAGKTGETSREGRQNRKGTLLGRRRRPGVLIRFPVSPGRSPVPWGQGDPKPAGNSPEGKKIFGSSCLTADCGSLSGRGSFCFGRQPETSAGPAEKIRFPGRIREETELENPSLSNPDGSCSGRASRPFFPRRKQKRIRMGAADQAPVSISDASFRDPAEERFGIFSLQSRAVLPGFDSSDRLPGSAGISALSGSGKTFRRFPDFLQVVCGGDCERARSQSETEPVPEVPFSGMRAVPAREGFSRGWGFRREPSRTEQSCLALILPMGFRGLPGSLPSPVPGKSSAVSRISSGSSVGEIVNARVHNLKRIPFRRSRFPE